MGLQERVVCLELVIERLGAVGVAVRLEGGDDVLRARALGCECAGGATRLAARHDSPAAGGDDGGGAMMVGGDEMATRLQQVGALDLAAKVVVQPSEMHCAAWIAAWIEVSPVELRACNGDTRHWAVAPPWKW